MFFFIKKKFKAIYQFKIVFSFVGNIFKKVLYNILFTGFRNTIFIIYFL